MRMSLSNVFLWRDAFYETLRALYCSSNCMLSFVSSLNIYILVCTPTQICKTASHLKLRFRSDTTL